jgi:hypothetical protein
MRCVTCVMGCMHDCLRHSISGARPRSRNLGGTAQGAAFGNIYSTGDARRVGPTISAPGEAGQMPDNER